MTRATPPSSPLPPLSCPPILLGIRSALGPALLDHILTQSRILLVGSGGIGCELLKNLALSGFRHVEVIDLDTIDVSNLNRQFLFRSHHVGMAKCKVASEVALRMVPPLGGGSPARFLHHHGNVCDNSKFNVPYVSQFDLVLNALDNVAARRRVNRLCLAASVPLVEAGTAGYLGQVTVIDKASGTECYECQTKATQKVYPICTIRSTPSQPVHCIVWAKELYKLCFGTRVEDSMLFEDEESLRADREVEKEKGGEDSGNVKNGNGANGKDRDSGNEGKEDSERSANGGPGSTSRRVASLGAEKSTYMDVVRELRSLLGVGSSGGAPSSDDKALCSKAQEALTALFVTEILKQIGMDRYKTADKVPVPISDEHIAACAFATLKPPTTREGYVATDVWSPPDCVAELASCFLEVAANASSPKPEQPLPEFDKDDDIAMRFVTAASNLRSCVFQIEPLQSLYDAKGIAGNIIPAIATTNAIVAGLQILQAFHILKAQVEDREGNLKGVCRYIYCLRDNTRKGYFLQPTALPDPNPNCFVCRNATISVCLNTHLWTLDMLLKRVIKKELGFGAPTIIIEEDIVYEEGEDIDPSEYSANLGKRLVDLPAGGVGHGTMMSVEDFTQDLEVEVNVSHRDEWVVAEEVNGRKGEPSENDREEIEKFEIGGKKPVALAVKKDSLTSKEDDKEDDAKAKTDAEGRMAKPDDEVDSDSEMEVFGPNDLPQGIAEAKRPAKSTHPGDRLKLVPEKRTLEEKLGSRAKRARFDECGGKKDDVTDVIEID